MSASPFLTGLLLGMILGLLLGLLLLWGAIDRRQCQEPPPVWNEDPGVESPTRPLP